MNLTQLYARQRKYALRLFTLGKIDKQEYGSMLRGYLEYSPSTGELFYWQERNPWVTNWPRRINHRHIGRI
ncbi:MAG: hypothetical protein CL484_03105 [Acidobacteria bacterium]|nr:hypothetical protein [Acidobacteriota bacterium]